MEYGYQIDVTAFVYFQIVTTDPNPRSNHHGHHRRAFPGDVPRGIFHSIVRGGRRRDHDHLKVNINNVITCVSPSGPIWTNHGSLERSHQGEEHGLIFKSFATI